MTISREELDKLFKEKVGQTVSIPLLTTAHAEDIIKNRDVTKKIKKPTFRPVDKDSLKTDSLNQFIEAAKVKDLSEFGFA